MITNPDTTQVHSMYSILSLMRRGYMFLRHSEEDP